MPKIQSVIELKAQPIDILEQAVGEAVNEALYFLGDKEMHERLKARGNKIRKEIVEQAQATFRERLLNGY